jgi:hypothetical protein
MVLDKIEIYYDGVNIQQNCGTEIKGFTTNITLLKTGFHLLINSSFLIIPLLFSLFEQK